MKNKYRMRHFTNGKAVVYRGSNCVVDYVVIRGFDLFVRLYNHSCDVSAEEVYCEPTTFRLTREDIAGSD